MHKIVFKASTFFRRDNWVSKLNSSLGFCYRLPVAEECLELSDYSSHFGGFYTFFTLHYIKNQKLHKFNCLSPSPLLLQIFGLAFFKPQCYEQVLRKSLDFLSIFWITVKCYETIDWLVTQVTGQHRPLEVNIFFQKKWHRTCKIVILDE